MTETAGQVTETAGAAAGAGAPDVFRASMEALLDRQDLSRPAMLAAMRAIMGGAWAPAKIAAFLTAMRMKGETVEELAAAAEVMRELSTRVDVAGLPHLIDTCGTGGDSTHTFNVSTASALVAAAAGAHVAKHGGRSVSSTCGSADVLEALGVNVGLDAAQVGRAVREIGIGFLFAPNHHGAMRHAAPVRRELGMRTLFNLLGPLTNPAGARRQVIGVFANDAAVKVARVLQLLGSEHVLAVHGADGMDEISITGPTFVAELRDGAVREYEVTPAQFGMVPAALSAIQVDSPAAARAMLLAVLDGAPGAARDIVRLNAGAAIYVAGLAPDLAAGVARATEVLAAGQARARLEALVRFSAVPQV